MMPQPGKTVRPADTRTAFCCPPRGQPACHTMSTALLPPRGLGRTNHLPCPPRGHSTGETGSPKNCPPRGHPDRTLSAAPFSPAVPENPPPKSVRPADTLAATGFRRADTQRRGPVTKERHCGFTSPIRPHDAATVASRVRVQCGRTSASSRAAARSLAPSGR